MRSHARASSAGSSTRQAKGLGRIVRGAFAARGAASDAGGSGAPSFRAAIALCAVAGALGLLAAPASAAFPTHPELPTLGQTGFDRVCGVAIDSSGNRYLADAPTKEVKIFSPSGAAITSFTASQNSENPCSIAVDSQGDVYVNVEEYEVVKYKPSSFPPSASTTYSPDTAVNGTGVLVSEGALGVAVNSATDDVYIPLGYEGISSYQPDGSLISSTIGASVGAKFTSVAVNGANGKIYAYSSEPRRAYVLSPDGSTVLAEVKGAATAAGSFEFNKRDIAVDQSNGHFYIADVGAGETNHKVVDEFDAGGALVSEIQLGSSVEPAGPSAVAVDNSGGANAGDVFVSVGENPSSVLAFGPPPPPTHPELPTLGQTGFQRICGLAIDSSGNRYLADAPTKEVKIFSPSGAAITSFTASQNSENPCSIAVDSQGDVYVNVEEYEVVKYKPSSFPPSASTTYSPDTAVNGTGVLVSEGALGVAVNSATDDVYIPLGYEGISSYQPDGSLISSTIGASVGAKFTSVAVNGANGKIYAYSSEPRRAYVLSPDGSTVLAEVKGAATAAGSFEFNKRDIAVDQSNGHFYIADVGAGETNHKVVDEFDAGGALVSEIQLGSSVEPAGPSAVAVDNSGGANAGDVFVSVGENPSSVLAFGPLTYAEFLNLEVAKTGAGAGKGVVTSAPVGISCGIACKAPFEKGTEVTLTATAEPGSKFASWKDCDTVVGNECKVAMSAKRKVTAKFNAKPAIEAENVQPLDTSATLEAEINPNGEETTYQFEFLTEEAYQANGESFSGPEEPLKLPEPPKSIGNGNSGVPVTAQVNDLTPNTAYRFRAVASNPAGDTEGDALAFLTYSPPNVFKPCSNDALRNGQPSGALPDCRAYEQASPLDKNGGDITGDELAPRASVDGNRVSYWVSAPIPGAEGAQSFVPPYLSTRGPDGWSAQGLLPPQREGQEAEVYGWTPDMSQIFGVATKIRAEKETKLYERSSLDHSLATIFPHSAAVSRFPGFPGSSDDGSIVFFENDGAPLLDGAAEGSGVQNLYVWDRDTGAVRLAGVLNDEEAPSAGAFAGPYDWMLEDTLSGGAIRKYYTRDPHVIAADGSSVYFTAGKSGQLYLRKNPAEPQSEIAINGEEEECTQPELACTIHVSASHKDNGPGGGPDPAGAQPAAFRAASTDGSVAYFTSPEMLTNDANTGPEQPPAGIGRAKIGASEGEEVQPSFLPKHAMGVTTSPDGKYVYWVDPVGGTIGRAELHGDGPPTNKEDEFIVPGPTKFENHPYKEPGVINDIPSHPRYLAVSDEYVYWTNTGTLSWDFAATYSVPYPEPESGTIGRAKLDSEGNLVPGEAKPEFITGASNPEGIAVNASHIYWANLDTPITSAHRAIGRATLAGATVEQRFYDPRFSQTATTLALDSNYLYAGTHDNGTTSGIIRIPLEGGDPEEQEGGYFANGTIGGIAIDGPYIYWTLTGKGIGRKPVSSINNSCGEDPECDLEYSQAEGTLGGFATDGSHLYWAANGEGTTNPGSDLYRYEADTGALTDVAPDSTGNGAEVLGVLGSSKDGSYVYFVANGALASGASLGDCQGTPERFPSGECNLYLEHGGQITFIARLDASNGGAGAWRGNAITPGGSVESKQSMVSADGHTVVFNSAQKLTDYENKVPGKLGPRIGEYYRYSVDEPNSIICVSCSPTGLPPTFGTGLDGRHQALGVTSRDPAPIQNRNLSADGNRFFFVTAEALVASDTNGNDGCPDASVGGRVCQDVYEWEAKGSGSCESEAQNGGCLYLISSGKSTDAAYFLDASASGDDAFFFTRSKLVAQDKDDLIDVYDARVGGGFATQNAPPPPPPCEGEACKDGPKAPPEVGSPSTPLFSGPGNPKPKHKKAKARKHRHKHKSHKHKRHAKKNGRAHR